MRSVVPLLATSLVLAGCAVGETDDGAVRITFSGSAVGEEGEVLRRQLEVFSERHPDVRVDILPTPDDADQRHQLYVQWLNARTPDPDIVQLDVIWTAEFAAAGWIAPLGAHAPDTAAFFPAATRAATWRGAIYALPLFVDVGMLYWRTDLLERAPRTYPELVEAAGRASGPDVPYGYVWQAARYEGLVVGFLEHLHAFGGRVLDAAGRVVVDAEVAVEALAFMRDALREHGVVPEVALTWREEQTRFAFQNGSAVLMRNWPYAYPLMQDTAASRVAGRFDVAPLPGGHGARNAESAATLGGSLLAINAHSRAPDVAWRVIAFLTSPEQMLDRARALGHYPARTAVYDLPELETALAVEAAAARALIEGAVPRPVSPVYPQISSILQVWIHRTLTGQTPPDTALARAAAEIRVLLERVELLPEAPAGTGRTPNGVRVG